MPIKFYWEEFHLKLHLTSDKEAVPVAKPDEKVLAGDDGTLLSSQTGLCGGRAQETGARVQTSA
jgi:hypothetical protein